MIIWLTGLSASGKTSLGRHVFELWKPRAPNTVVVDGDEIRSILKFHSGDEAYSVHGRHAVAARYCDLCVWLDQQKINVVCCTISSFEDLRHRNRENLSEYFEVYVAVPMDTLYRRDKKNLYAPALRSEIRNVVGVDIPFTPPANPDMVVDNAPDRDDLRPLAAEILEQALASKT